MRERPIDSIEDEKIQEAFRHIFIDAQDRQMTKVLTEPDATEIDERELKVLDAGSGTRRLYTKLDGTIYKIDLTEA